MAMEWETKYQHEEYLGDGLYAAFDGYQIILSANDKVGGERSTDRVALEPGVVRAFTDYLLFLRKKGVNI